MNLYSIYYKYKHYKQSVKWTLLKYYYIRKKTIIYFNWYDRIVQGNPFKCRNNSSL